MSLQKLDIYNVRNIQRASLYPSAAVNFIVGANGSGKSSLLEAIFILGRAQSFRTASIKKAIRFDSKELIVSGRVLQDSGHIATLGVQLDGKNNIVRIDRQNIASRSQLAYSLPVQLIYPKSYLLLDGSPHYRREFMDWGAFNHYPEFLPAWRRYKKALMHRNALLKQKQFRELDVWNQELLEYGTIVADFRRRYIALLAPVFIAIAAQFPVSDNFQLLPYNGWDDNRDYLQALHSDLDKDCRYGFTHSGPHRGDFHVLIGSRQVNDFVSRGQLKLLILALKLAQVSVLEDTFRTAGCVLIDDLSAELDPANRSKLLRFLDALQVQIFLTATQMDDFGDLNQIHEYRMFHVEQGSVKQL
ncbi:MAG: DNA replication/repair protein RecF [Gammaproteobacteria bacterium]